MCGGGGGGGDIKNERVKASSNQVGGWGVGGGIENTDFADQNHE